jgi:hypothetical protein
MSWEDIRQQLPTVRETVFLALREITPNRLAFERQQWPSKRFNTEWVDQDTQNLIMLIMAQEMNEPKLMFTRDEMTLCFHRFNELIMLHECCRQGIMKETTDSNGQVRYQILNADVKPTVTAVQTTFVARPIKYHAIIRIHPSP